VTGLPWTGSAPVWKDLRSYFPVRAGLLDRGHGRLEGVPAGITAIAVCGVSFAVTQLLVSNFLGPQVTDILSSLAALARWCC